MSEIIRISEPIKSHFAKSCGLDLKNLLSDGPYKELYRKDMINWSDRMRADNPDVFCHQAFLKGKNVLNCSKWNLNNKVLLWFLHQTATKPVVIVSDIRRRTDINYFQIQAAIENCKFLRVRITADDSVRKDRGWTFEKGVDDVVSECDLDDYVEWDFEIENNYTDTPVEKKLKPIFDVIKASLKPTHYKTVIVNNKWAYNL